MHSILSKFILLIVSALLFLLLTLGGFSLYVTNKITRNDSKLLMKETCEQKAILLNNELASIEQSVLSIEDYALYHLDDYDNLYNKNFAESFSKDVCDLAINIAEHTPGSVAVYMRYNPEITGDGKGGFFWSRKPGEGIFRYENPTDILQFPENDIEHVGWYYVPIKTNQSMWMDPYYNKNLNILMISFIVPVFVAERLVGVIGMDIDFSVFIDIAQNISIYKSGFAELACIDTKQIYYRNDDIPGNPVVVAEIPESFYYDLLPAQGPFNLIEYNYPEYSNKLCLTYQSLSNSMRIIVFAPKKEINAQRNALILYTVFLSVGVLGFGILITGLFAQRITRPLKQLTIAADHYCDGDWDFKVECSTHDEVLTLTKAMQKMAGETQSYIKQINDMAYKDALTGVKNKASYIKYVDEISESGNEFAVVVIDVNGLKTANDNYGHESGDMLIIDTCRLLCNIFIHSPVFRIGGDEFCVILTDRDYADKEKLFNILRGKMNYKEFTTDGKLKIAAASGMASFPADGSNYNEVFKIADEAMYHNKIDMKGFVR